MADIVIQLRNLSAKFNQMFGVMRMFPKIPSELRELLSDDSPDLASRAADEIVSLRNELKNARKGEDHG